VRPRLRLDGMHFSIRCLTRVIERCHDDPEFAPAMAALIHGDTGERRLACRKTQVRDDDWWCRRFGLWW
jgi:hypothetical protein